MKHSRVASRWNADLIGQNYEIWLTAPDTLDREWQAFFEGFNLGLSESVETDDGGDRGANLAPSVSSDSLKQARAIGLIYAYRSIGHTVAHINPLAKESPSQPSFNAPKSGLRRGRSDKNFPHWELSWRA